MTESFFWGIDVAAGGIDLSIVDGDGRWVASHRTRRKRSAGIDHAEQFADTGRRARSLMRLLASQCPPEAILVEQPLGAHPAPTLVGAWGIVAAEAFEQVGKAAWTEKPSQWRATIGLKNTKPASVEFGLSAGCPAGLEDDAYESTAMAYAARRWIGGER